MADEAAAPQTKLKPPQSWSPQSLAGGSLRRLSRCPHFISGRHSPSFPSFPSAFSGIHLLPWRSLPFQNSDLILHASLLSIAPHYNPSLFFFFFFGRRFRRTEEMRGWDVKRKAVISCRWYAYDKRRRRKKIHLLISPKCILCLLFLFFRILLPCSPFLLFSLTV